MRTGKGREKTDTRRQMVTKKKKRRRSENEKNVKSKMMKRN